MTTPSPPPPPSVLANPAAQVRVLESGPWRPFDQTLAEGDDGPLHARGVEVLQVNLGKRCNQTCRHCHVEAAPNRKEMMGRTTMRACLRALRRGGIPVLDITGGAPELNPHFRELIAEARHIGCEVIDRCNLTVLADPACQDLPESLAAHEVHLVASLPCYLAENVDGQRGDGTFETSIRILRKLNALGYGQPESGLLLSLVHNPGGPALPPLQATLEADYHRQLEARHGVVFSQLFTITNLPVGRFLDDLLHGDELDAYMRLLIDSYNPAAAAGVMCRNTVSVDWTGQLFDCDFNQMLELGLAPGLPQTIDDFDLALLAQRPIRIGQHCYGCTAGVGSSCQGAVLK